MTDEQRLEAAISASLGGAPPPALPTSTPPLSLAPAAGHGHMEQASAPAATALSSPTGTAAQPSAPAAASNNPFARWGGAPASAAGPPDRV